MKVIHLNNQLGGGAGMAALRIFQAVLNEGADVDFLFAHGPHNHKQNFLRWEYPSQSGVNNIITKLKAKNYYRKFNKYLEGRPDHLEHFSYAKYLKPTPLPQMWQEVDLVHLHQIDNFLDYATFFQSIPSDIPIVWSLHDMEPFTGGCHYAWDCEKYTSDCQSCPQLGPYDNRALAQKNLAIKLAALNGHDLHIVGNSHWTTARARESTLFRNSKSLQTIHYGIDLQACTTIDKSMAREVLGVGGNDFCLTFAAGDLANRRKGGEEVRQLLLALSERIENLSCLIFGHGGEFLEDLPMNIRNLGFVSSPRLKSIVYSAADVFIMSSLHEAFGQTALEALASSSPVIGFRTGGVVDMVKEGETGFLVARGEVNALYEKILECYIKPELVETMSRKARLLAENSFSSAKCGEAYVDLYQKALSSSIHHQTVNSPK